MNEIKTKGFKTESLYFKAIIGFKERLTGFILNELESMKVSSNRIIKVVFLVYDLKLS